jgi:hypothetical protein
MARRASIRLALLTIVALAGLCGPASGVASAIPPATYSCTPAPNNCSGWHTTNVVLKWFAPDAVDTENCPLATTLTAEGTSTWQCAVTADNINWVWAKAIVRIDKSNPIATGATPSRGPDANGWYRSPVGIAFHGTDAFSGIAFCTNVMYARPDTRAASVSGTCTDGAGHRSAAITFPFRYDATAPTVTRGRPSRKPDHGRWYNHPVTWHFRGRDHMSGLAECPPVVFRGPGGRAAHAIGACRDKAGNVGTRRFLLRYDDTPPAAPRVRAIPHDRSVQLRIHVGHDARRMSIVRAPGIGGAVDSTVYRGRPRGFTDRQVPNGKRYRYTVTVRDRAANRSRTVVRARPGASLLSPANGAVLIAPPLLRWTAIRGASYYNVQLVRDGRKVLSTWPGRPRLQLKGRWKFEGHVRRLVPGHYRWAVWPGFGPRSDARYGGRVGSRSFVIPAGPPAQ